MTTPAHCIQLRVSPKRMMENSTTNMGREPLSRLTVVSGRSFSPTIPEIQDAVTSTALKASRR